MQMKQIDKKEVLYLTIMKVFFDQIINGEKTKEYREPTDYWIRRLFVVEGDKVLRLKPFRYVRLCVGYHKDREEALVEIKNIGFYEFINDIPDGFEKGDKSLVIELGEVVSKKLKSESSGKVTKTVV